MFESANTQELEARVLGGGALEELRQSLAGQLVLPGDPSYDTARH